VLVNNAGNFYAGFFEEISSEHFRAQVETNLFGPLNVTRAVLPGSGTLLVMGECMIE
jgi:NAD(P)-dependent dehydrogenase (short-subunit alcohol dehydrogenase family)